jgi:hypothetical protein
MRFKVTFGQSPEPSQDIGLEPLAGIYSLPWALLMSFSLHTLPGSPMPFPFEQDDDISLLFFCFTISSTSTRIATGTTSLYVAAWSHGAFEALGNRTMTRECGEVVCSLCSA